MDTSGWDLYELLRKSCRRVKFLQDGPEDRGRLQMGIPLAGTYWWVSHAEAARLVKEGFAEYD